MMIHQEKYSVTPSSGTVGQTIYAGTKMMKLIFVKATTSSTTFDVKLTDIYDNDIFVRDDNTGELNEEIETPCIGNMTLTISNSSVDEAFDILILFLE